MKEIDYKSQIIKILYEKNPLSLSQLQEKFLLRVNLSANEYDFSKFLCTIWAMEDEGILKREGGSRKFYLTEKGKEEAEKIFKNFPI